MDRRSHTHPQKLDMTPQSDSGSSSRAELGPFIRFEFLPVIAIIHTLLSWNSEHSRKFFHCMFVLVISQEGRGVGKLLILASVEANYSDCDWTCHPDTSMLPLYRQGIWPLRSDLRLLGGGARGTLLHIPFLNMAP